MKKKGKHEAGPGVRRKREPGERLMNVLMWTGGAVGLAFGLIYFKRNPDQIPARGRSTGAILGYYTGLGMGAGVCLFLLGDRIRDRIRARRRQ